MKEKQIETQELLEEINQLLISARRDYEEKHFGNCPLYISEFNNLLTKATSVGFEFEISFVEEAEHDRKIHHSHTMGEPYDPKTYASKTSEARKLREIIMYLERLLSKAAKESLNLIPQKEILATPAETNSNNLWNLLHYNITDISRTLFDSKHYAEAVLAAMREVNLFCVV